MGVGVCKVGKDVRELVKAAEKGRDAENNRKGRSNVGKIKAFEKQIKDGHRKLDVLDGYLTDIFDG